MGWFTSEKEVLYNGIWLRSSDVYHVVFLKNDYDAWQLAQYVFHWYGLLHRELPIEPPAKTSSVPKDYEVGFPGLAWVSGISRDETQWYIDIVAERKNWWFGAADLLTIPVAQVERNRHKLRELARRNGARFHRLAY